MRTAINQFQQQEEVNTHSQHGRDDGEEGGGVAIFIQVKSL